MAFRGACKEGLDITQTLEKIGLSSPAQELSPFLGLRRDVDRLFDEFVF